MEDHKSEIENWELGAGIYISFYLTRNSLHDDTNSMTELVCEYHPSHHHLCEEWLLLDPVIV